MVNDHIETGLKGCTLMPLLNSAFLPGRCRETVQAMEDPKQRDIAMGEYYYFSGHPEEAAKQMEPYLASEETALAFQSQVYPIPNIYLHLVAVMDYMSLNMPKDNGEPGISGNRGE